ncbi:IS200/IS605 family transposase [bacterium]|nr:IS200/IS605 family transposase [bacterium]MCB2213059.1 IS200/IS605 family transposase [bacterium]
MSELIRKQHNVSILLYHLVCVAKYRRVVFDEPEIDLTLKDICFEIQKRYELEFIEIGIDRDHVHFLVQSVPTMSATKIVRTIKSITAREMFIRQPKVKKHLWGGEFWTKGYYISTVGPHGDEDTIRKYVMNQGTEANYQPLYQSRLEL